MLVPTLYCICLLNYLRLSEGRKCVCLSSFSSGPGTVSAENSAIGLQSSFSICLHQCLPVSVLASDYSALDIAIHHIYFRVFYSCHPHEAGMTSETLDIFPKDNMFVWGHSLYFFWIQSWTTLNSARWENVFTLLLLISRLKMASQRFSQSLCSQIIFLKERVSVNTTQL